MHHDDDEFEEPNLPVTEPDEQNGTRVRKMITRSKILSVDIIEWPAEDRWLKHS